MEFSSLPRDIGVHPELNTSIFVEVAAKCLSVGVQGFPLRIPLPDGIYPSQVTLDVCLDLLPSTREILKSNRFIGLWNGEEVSIRRSRFGFYIKCGAVNTGLGKLSPEEITLEQAIRRLESKLKRTRTKSSKSKGTTKRKKSSKSTLVKSKKRSIDDTRTKPKSKRSAYHVRMINKLIHFAQI